MKTDFEQNGNEALNKADVMQSVIKELQIGNFIFFGDSICEVVEIQENCFYVKNKDGEEFKSTWADLSVIKLTDELLLKINFQLIKGSSYLINSYFSIDFEGHLFYRNDYVGINLCYLHRLQNFFRLLKRELTVA